MCKKAALCLTVIFMPRPVYNLNFHGGKDKH